MVIYPVSRKTYYMYMVYTYIFIQMTYLIYRAKLYRVGTDLISKHSLELLSYTASPQIRPHSVVRFYIHLFEVYTIFIGS